MKRLLFTLFFIALITSCAASGPLYQDAPKPKENDALIYIYRPSSWTLGMRDAYFYINDVNIVDLSDNGYTWLHVPTGGYTLKLKWPLDVQLLYEVTEINAKWTPGRRYFYRLNTWHSGYVAASSQHWQLSEVEEAKALLEIGSCNLQPAFGSQKLLEQINRK